MKGPVGLGGIDPHRRRSFVTAIDERGEVSLRRRIVNDREAFLELLGDPRVVKASAPCRRLSSTRTQRRADVLSRQLRKAVKTKGHFPSEDAARWPSGPARARQRKLPNR